MVGLLLEIKDSFRDDYPCSNFLDGTSRWERLTEKVVIRMALSQQISPFCAVDLASIGG